ncbi:hypothetical protein B296_00042430, partial [Ensete ventricosum]
SAAAPACGLAAVDRACGWLPIAGGLVAVDRPLQVARPWSAAPARGLAVASHLCMQTACMWPPLPRRQRLLSLPIAATSA